MSWAEDKSKIMIYFSVKENETNLEALLVDVAKKYIAILMQLEDTEIRIENYHMEDFLKNLIYNKNINENDVKRKSKFYKWDLS